jgi:hypothetical protein
MELFEYTGEVTDEEIQHRLDEWFKWDKRGYKANHLRIQHICPVCNSMEDTEWVRQEYNICYKCMISFTLADLQPVYDPKNPPAELFSTYEDGEYKEFYYEENPKDYENNL